MPLAVAVSMGLATSAPAQGIGAKPVGKGTPVVLVGEISSQPRDFGVTQEQKMQVAVGSNRVDHTLHLRDAKMVDQNGREIHASGLLDKWWVRAEGQLMEDPRRVDVTRLRVIAKDFNNYKKSRDYMARMPRGYVIAENVAGERQVLSTTRPFKQGHRVVVMAPISSQPRDAGVAVEDKMQVAIGPSKTDYTLHFEGAKMIGPDGEKIAASGLRDKMWVRAEGTVMEDARRIKVDYLEVIASDESGFQRSGTDFGYIIGPRARI